MSTDFRGLWMLAGAWLAAWFLPPVPVMIGALALLGLLFAFAARRRHDPPFATPWFAGPLVLLAAGLTVMAGQLGHQPCQLPEQEDGIYRVLWDAETAPSSFEGGTWKGKAQLSAYWQDASWHSCSVQLFATGTQPLPGGVAGYEAIMRLEPTGSRHGIQYWATANGAVKGHGIAPASRTSVIKDGFAHRLQHVPAAARALLPGMLYGDRSLQDEALSDAMKAGGLSHLTAVSGSNCAIIGALVLLVLRALGANRVVALLGLGVALLLFTLLVGPEPSVLRAAVMGAIAALSLHWGRGRASLGILCLSATVLLILTPSLAGEPAFALSVLATVGIIVFAPLLTGYLGRAFPRLLAEPIAICAAAQLTCLPVVIALSERFSLYSIPLNLVVTPLVPVITVLGMLCVLLVLAVPGLVSVLVWIPALPAWGIGELALWAAGWPGASRPWPAGGLGVAIAVGFTVLLCAAVLYLAHGERRWLRTAASRMLGLLLVALAALVLPGTLLLRPEVPDWHLAMCDVGQGDAFVIHTAADTGWLIDTGSEDTGVLDCLRQLNIDTLSKVFLTHAHEDHMGALAQLQESSISMGAPLVSSGFDGKIEGDSKVLNPGDTAAEGPVSYTVLGPDPQAARQASANDTSLVLRIEFRVSGARYSFFAAGDMEEQSMGRLLQQTHPAPVSVLKASHHGARNAGTEIIAALQPRMLLVSAGRGNSYGHPHPEILAAAAEAGAQVLRTDTQGTVTITFDSGRVIATRIGAPVR